MESIDSDGMVATQEDVDKCEEEIDGIEIDDHDEIFKMSSQTDDYYTATIDQNHLKSILKSARAKRLIAT
jgi:hypothetical protein